jgi:hypothetical protein
MAASKPYFLLLDEWAQPLRHDRTGLFTSSDPTRLARCFAREIWLGLVSGACAHPVAVLAFHRRAASITPARREHLRRLPRSFLRIAPAGPPGADDLSVSFVVAVWPPLPRERPTHQL